MRVTKKDLLEEIGALRRVVTQQQAELERLKKEEGKAVYFDRAITTTFLVAVDKLCDALAHTIAHLPQR